jgi:hypothetical protein
VASGVAGAPAGPAPFGWFALLLLALLVFGWFATSSPIFHPGHDRDQPALAQARHVISFG